MSDALAAPEAAPPPAPPAPGLTAQEIEALIERKAQEISDRRVSGLQAMYDKKLSESQKQMQQLRQQLLPDDVRVDSDYEAKLQEKEREIAVLRAAQQYPDVYPVYEQLIGFDSAEQQMAFLAQLTRSRAEAAAAAPPPPAPAPQPDQATPPVDPNSPPSGIARTSPLLDPNTATDAELEAFWDTLPHWPTPG